MEERQFMEAALELAKEAFNEGEVPVGCVIVRNGEIVGRGRNRRETAKTAKENGFDSFTSSLFISPYQNHELMKEVAERAAAEFGVEFLYRDFREVFKAGQTFAREHEYYMHKYCG